MEVSLEEFKDLCLTRGILAPDSVLESVYKELKKRLAASGDKANDFIATYCDAFKARYRVFPEMKGRPAGVAKRIVKALGNEKACALVETYLLMNEFVGRNHDLVSFEMNINKVKVFHETGRTVNQTQARRLEQVDANAQAIREYREKQKARRET